MKKIRAKTGLEDIRFLDLRHEATSRFFENTDLDVMEVKAITGHKTLQMLSRYTHLRTARLADRLAGARRGSKIKLRLKRSLEILTLYFAERISWALLVSVFC